MKKLLIAATALLSLCFTPQLILAQDVEVEEEIVKPKKAKNYWIYGDANFALNQFSVSQGNETATSDMMTAAYFRVGAKYKYFGVEGELGTGLSDWEEDGTSYGMESQTAIFGILRYPVNENADAYIRAGYHSTKFEIGLDNFDFGDGNGPQSFSDTFTEDGFAFGLGGTYFFKDNIGVRGDITSYRLKDNLILDDAVLVGGSLGVVAKF